MNTWISIVGAFVVFCVLSGDAFRSAFNTLQHATRLSRHESIRFMSTEDFELDIGDLENVVFKKASTVTGKIGKYTLDATVPTSALNSYLDEYKEEMKRRKVTFPGFRHGKLPPYVMGDVRKYLVCYGLETMLGTLCNNNALKLCTETGEDVPFGEDVYYEEIIKEDFRGYDFQKQRDTWREGTPFKFQAEFFCLEEGDSSSEETDSSTASVIETTAVPADAGSS